MKFEAEINKNFKLLQVSSVNSVARRFKRQLADNAADFLFVSRAMRYRGERQSYSDRALFQSCLLQLI